MAYIQGFVISLNVYKVIRHHSSKIYKSFTKKVLKLGTTAWHNRLVRATKDQAVGLTASTLA